MLCNSIFFFLHNWNIFLVLIRIFPFFNWHFIFQVKIFYRLSKNISFFSTIYDNYYFFFNFSLIGNEDALSVYELHIAVKDHCFGFGREDRLVGVAVMQLKDIEDQVSYEQITKYKGTNQIRDQGCQFSYYFHSSGIRGIKDCIFLFLGDQGIQNYSLGSLGKWIPLNEPSLAINMTHKA